MALYAIGDIQGCYSCLCRLLEETGFDQTADRLWFCGDLVNRGPESLQTLRFVRSLGDSAITVLGNHDLHLLALYHRQQKLDESDSLYQVLNSADCDMLMDWLRNRPLIHYDDHLSVLLVHAGIHPQWQLKQALSYAGEVEVILRGPDCGTFLSQMYGDRPEVWSDDLAGPLRLRCITNILTRMRYFDKSGRLQFQAKAGPANHPELVPWFEVDGMVQRGFDIVFGHWSTLPVGVYGGHFAMDGGCVWGGKMVAVNLESEKPQWYSIDC